MPAGLKRKQDVFARDTGAANIRLYYPQLIFIPKLNYFPFADRPANLIFCFLDVHKRFLDNNKRESVAPV